MPVDFDIGGGFDGLFGDLLSAFGFGKGGERGDVKKDVTVSFEQAAFGCEKDVTFDRVETCGDCNGTGAAPGSSMRACSACNGRGKVRFQQGFFPLPVERACSRCRGTGRIVVVPCGTCRGEGLIRKTKTLKVHIPAGVENEATHLVQRAGNVVRPGRAAGDLELTIRIAPHDFFRRVADDVVCTVPVSFPQATLGAEVEVPTLDGKGKLRIPPGTQPGSVLRIRGKGIPRRVVGGRGDQLVEIAVEVPVQLSDRARSLLAELSEELGAEVQPQRRTFLEKLKDLFG